MTPDTSKQSLAAAKKPKLAASTDLHEIKRADSITVTLSDPVKDGRIRISIASLDGQPVIDKDERLVIRPERGQIVLYRQTKAKK
jgi:hypothetical protein